MWKFTNLLKTAACENDLPPTSFFDFFNPPSLNQEVDGEEQDLLEMKVATDYAYGEMFKEKLIPDAVDWFIGEAVGAIQDEDEDEGGDDSY